MSKKTFYTWLIICFYNHLDAKVIKPDNIIIICTAALIDNQYNQRKFEYLTAISQVISFGFIPYIVESCVEGPTFFENLSTKVYYSKTNNSLLKNKGVNEALSLISFFDKFKFAHDPLVIKLTGRYQLNSDTFLKVVMNNQNMDAFIKMDSLGQVFTGCFALRYKFFKEMLCQLNLNAMEKNMINFENEVADYIKKNPAIKTFVIDHIDISARIGNCDKTCLL